MIQSIIINDFRILKDINFNLGKMLTVIAGQNGTGKTNILGLLGNSCELKTSLGRPVLQSRFRAEFRELFKGSLEHDPSGSNKYTVKFTDSVESFDQVIETRTFRVSWQENKTRFRVIPRNPVTKREGKVEYPVLYLGLSRLFPIGESKDDLNTQHVNLTDDEKEWFVSNYNSVLNLTDQLINVNNIKIPETKNKIGVGVQTVDYDYNSISSGQDNIGQILFAILSFKRLKDSYSEYKGGLLLIDEIDASLHPASQIKLINLLIKESRRLSLQIVCTTHSLNILEYITKKTSHNKNENNEYNNIELIYLSKNGDLLKCKRNPNLRYIKNNLEMLRFGEQTMESKIDVYSEDNEARWFLRKLLLSSTIDKLNIIDVKMGHENLLDLRKHDPKYFRNVIFVVDGDVEESKINEAIDSDKPILNNFIKLPGNDCPEKVFFNYLNSLSDDHPFWSDKYVDDASFTKQYLATYHPETSDAYEGIKERDRYKAWFNEHLPLFERSNLFEIWKQDNIDDVNLFQEQFNRLVSEYTS